MTTDLRLDAECVTAEMAIYARAFTSGDERAMDNAEADFDNLISALDVIQQGDSANAERASLDILRANAAREAVLAGWAEA